MKNITDNKGILVIELKGFTAICQSLEQNMQNIELSSDKIRQFIIDINTNIINETKKNNNYEKIIHIGGDTWYIHFNNSIIFAGAYLNIAQKQILTNGYFYLKPSLGISYGIPSLSGNRFLDDESINAYKLADKGVPFTVYLTEKVFNILDSQKNIN